MSQGGRGREEVREKGLSVSFLEKKLERRKPRRLQYLEEGGARIFSLESVLQRLSFRPSFRPSSPLSFFVPFFFRSLSPIHLLVSVIYPIIYRYVVSTVHPCIYLSM